MAIALNFKNVPHALATFFKRVAAGAKVVAADAEKIIDQVESEKTTVETVSGAVANAVAPGSGVAVVTIEDAAFSLLGTIDAVLKSGGDAATQKLLDAGLDVTAIDNVKAVGSQSASFYTLLQSVKA